MISHHPCIGTLLHLNTPTVYPKIWSSWNWIGMLANDFAFLFITCMWWRLLIWGLLKSQGQWLQFAPRPSDVCSLLHGFLWFWLFCRKLPPPHPATAPTKGSSTPTSFGRQPFVRRVVERRTVHNGPVRDRQAPPSDAPLPLATHEDSAVIGRSQRVSFFNKLTSKFTKRCWLLLLMRYV